MDARDYAGPADLERMQALASECWRLAAPHVSATAADPAWWLYQHLDKLREVAVRLWLDAAGEARAWAWLRRPGALFWLAHPHDHERLLPRVLDWFEGEAQPDEESVVSVFALASDRVARAELERRGYGLHADAWMEHFVRDLAEPPDAPRVPEGYRLRAVRGRADLERRVEVHRSAFAPSRVVPESYAQVMTAPLYRLELDRVVEAPDGSFAAFCLCWLDAANALGELEPVGTHAEHRRRGLARAACLSGLAALRGLGARTAVVYAVGGSGAARLYESLGFRSVDRHVEFRKAPGKEPEHTGVPSGVDDDWEDPNWQPQ